MSETWHAIAADEVVSIVGTDSERGLSSSEVLARLEQYGKNEVSKKKRRSLLKMFLSQFANPLVLVLLVAAGVTFALADYIDTIVIMIVVMVNAVIGFVQEERAESAIESLARVLVVESTVVRDGDTIRISSVDIVPGDVLILQGGDKVPADARILQERNLHTDESALTGESVPVSKSSHPVHANEPVSDRVCMVYSGTFATAGSARVVVVATGDDTEIGLISEMISSAPKIVTPLTQKLAKFGKWLSAAVLVISAIAFGIGVLTGYDPVDMFGAAVAIAVAMIPEGLPAIVTIILAVGIRRMAKRNVIIRSLPSVETLGSVTVICSDKTGTLTQNEMTVTRAFADGKNYEFGGIGYDPTLCCVVSVDTDQSELQSPAFIECLKCGLLCNDSELVQENDHWKANGDPTEVALIVSAAKAGLDPRQEREKHSRVDVVPFESANMYMATLNEYDDGRIIYVKGSIEQVLNMCSGQLCSDGIGKLDRGKISARADDLAKQGYRIMSFARKLTDKSNEELNETDLLDLVFLGFQVMNDPPRPEAIAAVRECHDAGIELKMITGDHVSTARAIAREMGIGRHEAISITGSELAKLNDEEFTQTAVSTSVFARVAPEQKYRLVEALQASQQKVAMTGDGVNDAPALKKADIGIAMGKAGSEVAKDASDMVLTDDNFTSIVAAVEEGRTVIANLIKALVWILPTNLGEGFVIIAALVTGLTLPATPIQILWINTVTAITLALPIAFEPREMDLMKLPPRRVDSPLISRVMFYRIIIVAVSMVVGAFIIFQYERGVGASLAEARTAAVATIVGFEIFYLFSARSQSKPFWQTSVFSNMYIWLGVSMVVIFQLAFTYLPLFNLFFDSRPLSLAMWGRILLASFPVMLIADADKVIHNYIARQKTRQDV